MAREPELSIKVKVDPTIDRTKFQQDIDKLIPQNNPIKINGAFDAAKALQSITDYQNQTGKAVPIFAKISNVDSVLQTFDNETFDVKLKATQDSIDNVKKQLETIDADVTLNATQAQIDTLKQNIETKIGTIDITPDITDAHLKAIRQKIENELNKIKFNPWPNNGPGSKGKGGGGGTSDERKLARNMMEQAQTANKLSAAKKNNYRHNIGAQNARQQELTTRDTNLRTSISKTDPNYKTKEWYRQAEQDAKYKRDDYTSTQADKEDLAILQKLTAALDKRLQLTKDLHKINKQNAPPQYAEKKNEIKETEDEIKKIRAQAKSSGVNTSGVTNEFLVKAQDLRKQFILQATPTADELFAEYQKELSKMQINGRRYANSIGKGNSWEELGNEAKYKQSQTNLNELENKINKQGFNSLAKYNELLNERIRAEGSVTVEIDKRIDAQKKTTEVDDKDVKNIGNVVSRLERYKQILSSTDTGIASSDYTFVSKIAKEATALYTKLDENYGADKNVIAKNWAQQFGIKDINSLADALARIQKEAGKAEIGISKFSDAATKERREIQAQVQIANLQSQLHDYLEKFPKVEKKMGTQVTNLRDALAAPDAYKDVRKLTLEMADLRKEAKKTGLETENLIDKFENLLGQHLSTMITMAALHQMQNALRVIYQNVVDIDTAMTELRKVTNLTEDGYEKFMIRAAKQAQELGASISDIINSTSDWVRLGYDEKDAENLATYSTLLKNVGDGIDDVNTSSSYLISTLQGFGLVADQAEDVVNKIDAVANTQPVTANDIGEILTRSSAAMSAANNTLDETIALGTAANAVIQNADTVGTTLKTLSMYLRAAKTDAEAAGIEVDGMADSVSKLRTELKSLTGVDIMADNKNFKSTYQIMKEISEVWGSLTDVSKANVTEMLAGKRNANAVSAILNNFSVAESAMESAANSANVAWEENEKYLDSIQGRINILTASFESLSVDFLDSDLVKTVVSLATALTKAADAMIKFGGAIPTTTFFGTFATQLGEPKMTGFTIVPSNTPGGDTEQACGAYYIECYSVREYLVKPTNMVA